MFFIIIMFILLVVGFSTLMIGLEDWNDNLTHFGAITVVIGLIMAVTGFFHGFINYPPTEGTHQGVLTAVDLEGVYFRHYDVYLKSSGYTEQSDETKYCIYEYEKSLSEDLRNALGKKVKLHYSHKGGYINWKSCGTYHIDSVEIVEE